MPRVKSPSQAEISSNPREFALLAQAAPNGDVDPEVGNVLVAASAPCALMQPRYADTVLIHG